MTDYKEIFDSNPIGMWKIDLENNYFVEINKSALNLIGALNIQEAQNIHFLNKDFLNTVCQQKELKNHRIILNSKNGIETSVVVSAKLNSKDKTIDGTIQECPVAISLESAIKPYIKKISDIKDYLIEKLNEPSVYTGPS